MSEPEKFIARWSRRKRDAEKDAETATSPATPDAAAPGTSATEDARNKMSGVAAAPSTAAEPLELAFDLAKLPAIESITAESDIRAFLAPGVPPELTRAALRRAWSADPKIRDFVGLADYDWDFNTPGAIAGFGPLEMTDELRRQVAQMVGRSLAVAEPGRPAPTPAEVRSEQAAVETPETSIESFVATAAAPTAKAPSNVGISQDDPVKSARELHNCDGILQPDQNHIATQHNSDEPDSAQLIVKRLHGRALPK
jgi:Protein of unknown function (DUF3306)